MSSVSPHPIQNLPDPGASMELSDSPGSVCTFTMPCEDLLEVVKFDSNPRYVNRKSGLVFMGRVLVYRTDRDTPAAIVKYCPFCGHKK